MKMPSFTDFVNVKNPAMAILYVALLGIGWLYIDLRKTQRDNFKEALAEKVELKKTIVSLRFDVDLMQVQLRKRDSAMADMTATLRVLKQLKKIE